MRAVAVALLMEEQRGEIVATWRRDVERELGGEPALAFAVGPLLREMALGLRGDAPALVAGPVEVVAAGARSAVLVRSGAPPGRVAREFRLLHRALWQALKQAGAVVAGDERRAADEWLDEALAVTIERLDRLRARADLVEGAPAGAPPLTPWIGAPPAASGEAPRPPPGPRPSAAVPPRSPAPEWPAVARPLVIPARPPAARPPPLPLPRSSARPPPLPVAAQDVLALE